MLGDVLPRRTVRASVLWAWMLKLLGGLSVRAASEGLPFALETFRALKRRVVRDMERIRTRLWGKKPPPASRHSDPLLQTCEHLQSAFAGSACPVAAFQLHFQVPFFA